MTVEIAERPAASELKLLEQTRVSLEKLRIQMGNRISALERGTDDATDEIALTYQRIYEASQGWEEEVESLLARQVRAHPVWDYWLKHVKGVGPGLAAQMLALLLPPLPDRGPSTWYKAAGLIVEEHDGLNRLPRARAGGGKIQHHPWLRRCLWLLATSFVRVGGYYREVYEDRKARLQAQHAGDANWPPYRLDSVARWITVKLFLAHLWEVWLEAEGKTGRRAYVIDHLGHHYVAPPRPNGDGKKL